MTETSKAKKFSSYCDNCFANTESECYCNRIVGYFPRVDADIPIVTIYQDEWDEYLSNSSIKVNNKNSENLKLHRTDKDKTKSSHPFLIPEDIIKYLASLDDSDTASIIREGYAEEYNIPVAVIDTLVFRFRRMHGDDND